MSRLTVSDTGTDLTFNVEGYEGYVHLSSPDFDMSSGALTVGQARALASALEHFANQVEYRS